MSHLTTVRDVRKSARRCLPRAIFDIIDGGSDDEITMRANEHAFDRVLFQPRVPTSRCDQHDLTTTALGHRLAVPVMLAPCGMVNAVGGAGATDAAAAAHQAGTVSVASCLSGSPIEEITAAAPAAVWYQLYLLGGRDEVRTHLRRAAEAGCKVIVLTVDTPVSGRRLRDVRNATTLPMRMSARTAWRQGPQLVRHPRWTLWATRRRFAFLKTANAAAQQCGGRPISGIAVTWDDVRWVRQEWDAKLVVKGILRPEDAESAVRLEADGIIVSNHGGRQLDGVPASLCALTKVVEVVDATTEVYLDSGVRRGADIVKAISLGARATLIGRPYLYGLATGGRSGVLRVLDIFRDEIDRTLTLLGCPSVAKLDSTWIDAAAL